MILVDINGINHVFQHMKTACTDQIKVIRFEFLTVIDLEPLSSSFLSIIYIWVSVKYGHPSNVEHNYLILSESLYCLEETDFTSTIS